MTAAVAIAAALGLPGTAAAQQTTPDNEPLPRWDVTGILGWHGVQIHGADDNFHEWDGRFSYGGIFGYYWTSNIKTEVEVGGLAPSEFYTYVQKTVSGLTFPAYVRTEHNVTGVPLAGRVLYQFGENEWFHPFAAAGITLDTTRDEAHTPRQTTTVSRPPGSNTFVEILVSEESTRTETTHDARGVLMLGFKAYATERAFMRTDFQWSLGPSRQRFTSWRIGVGVDF